MVKIDSHQLHESKKEFFICSKFIHWYLAIPEYSVTEVSSFQGTQHSMFLPPHLRMEADPVSETLCSLVFRIPDNEQNPKISIVRTL
jgi:hypothetical protein